MSDCDHIEDGFDYTDEGLVYTRFTYCPKCGEKTMNPDEGRQNDTENGIDETPDDCDTVKHLTERNIKSEVLAVIHAYDETAESKLARIWKILGEKA